MKKYIILLALTLLLTGCGAPKDTLSINGMYLGKKASTDRSVLVMDASFAYMDKEVGYSVDSEDRIDAMEFHKTEDASGEIICGLSDIKLMYHGERLETTEDIIACFGENYVPVEGEKYETFTFEDDKLLIEVTLVDKEFSGIEVTPK